MQKRRVAGIAFIVLYSLFLWGCGNRTVVMKNEQLRAEVARLIQNVSELEKEISDQYYSVGRWPGIELAVPEIHTVNEEEGINVVYYWRHDYHHDSGPFAAMYFKNRRYYNPFKDINPGDSYREFIERIGQPFHEWAGGSNEVWYKYRYGMAVLNVEDDRIIDISWPAK